MPLVWHSADAASYGRTGKGVNRVPVTIEVIRATPFYE